MKLFGWKFEKDTKEKPKTNLELTKKELDDGTKEQFYSQGAYGVTFDQEYEDFASENDIIEKYRTISNLPEIDIAINDIINEAIINDHITDTVTINLEKTDLSDDIKKLFVEEFKEVLNLLNFHNDCYEIFKRWYVEGRLFYSVVIDTKNPKAGIQELRPIDSLKIKKVIEKNNKQEYVEYFKYTENINAQVRPLTKDSIVYVHSGMLNTKKTFVISNLHKAIRPYNQLKLMEDSLIIYRITRAPERRVFYIDVGNLPKGKAEQYISNIMNKYRNKPMYNSSTGDVEQNRHHQAMIEDYWLPRREGKGTEVDTLGGGESINISEDLEYFKQKLYKSLHVPIERFGNENSFTLGREGDITRDELKFSKFISRLQLRFSNLFTDILRRQLILKQIINPKDWESVKNNINYKFLEDSYYNEVKSDEVFQGRISLLSDLEDKIGDYFSKEFVRKNILKMTQEEIDVMKRQIDAEKKSGEIPKDDEI